MGELIGSQKPSLDLETHLGLGEELHLGIKWKDKFVNLLKSVEHSGYQATGLILVNDKNRVSTIKEDKSASVFLERESVKKTLEADLQTIIGHCRFPTKGSVLLEKNNHPFSTENTTIVHKGVLFNDEELCKKYDLIPGGDTDSWIIVELIEYYRKKGKSTIDAIAQVHSELKGSWAVALVDSLEPEKLYLFCHGKEFRINYYPDENIFMFCTEDKKLNSFSTEVETYFDYFEEVKDLRVAELLIKDEDCVIIGGEKVVEMWELPSPYPEYEFSNHRRRFGDGWGANNKKIPLENKTEVNGEGGRLPIKNINLVKVPKKGEEDFPF